jgi:nucleotide-binding universal stress UspA family protein
LDEYAETAHGLLATAPQAPALKVSEGRAALPFDAIMQSASDVGPDLLVMGSHGHSRFSKLLMGSTAEKVLRHAPCNVLTVKAGAPIPEDGVFHTIMAPVDFSEWARHGLDGARAINADSDATIYLVHVVEPAPPMYLAGNISSYFELDPELRERIETIMRTWSGDIPNARIMITEGSPALEVARIAESVGADLIVMSTKGVTAAERLLVGSVTERVCRFSAAPVLVIRP